MQHYILIHVFEIALCHLAIAMSNLECEFITLIRQMAERMCLALCCTSASAVCGVIIMDEGVLLWDNFRVKVCVSGIIIV